MIDSKWMELKLEGKNIIGRSYHTAVYYQDTLYIYGGCEISKGILDEFYQINIFSKHPHWKFLPPNRASKLAYPGPRRKHSAVVFND